MLVNLLILFFLLLIIYQLLLGQVTKIEGFNTTYTNYNLSSPDNALILAQQNAGNVSYLKDKVDELSNINKEVHDISMNVAQLNSQMNQLAQAQAQAAASLVGTTPPQISGTTQPIIKT